MSTLPTVQELRALVKRRRRAGASMWAIATATGLRLRVVRSILAGGQVRPLLRETLGEEGYLEYRRELRDALAKEDFEDDPAS